MPSYDISDKPRGQDWETVEQINRPGRRARAVVTTFQLSKTVKRTRAGSGITPSKRSRTEAEGSTSGPQESGYDENTNYVDIAHALRHQRATPKSKTQQDFMQDWLPKQNEYLQAILESEAPWGDESPVCSQCTQPAQFRFQPFHRMDEWQGEYFHPCSKWQLRVGLYISFGHGGDSCGGYEQEERVERVDREEDDVETEEDEEEEDVDDIPGQSSSEFQPEQSQDSFKNPILTVVHTNGLHFIQARFCVCRCEPLDRQCIAAGLYPASQRRVRTVFTQQVLDDCILDRVECKTTTHNYFAKLRRLTSDTFPHLVADRYRELLRCVRQWIWIRARMKSGTAHDSPDGKDIKPGGLVTYCAACPQPGVNLPEGWELDRESWMYVIQLIKDGNFKQEHLQYKANIFDVRLSDGLGFMVGSMEYLKHLKETINQPIEVSDCREHRAVTQTHVKRNNLASTGIGAVACARHGCFVPHSVVDFQKGERQANMDYAFVNAVKFWGGRLTVVQSFYDVACQWHKNLRTRLAQYQTLRLDWDVIIRYCIGQWHVHGHKKECFTRYSPLFVPGIGWVDGEIIETLWSSLNEVSSSLRAMGTAHRQESMDMHMEDLNMKKMVSIVPSIGKKYMRAVDGYLESNLAFTQIQTTELVKQHEATWLEQANAALQGRAANMANVDMMAVFDMDDSKAPRMADILLRLTTQERGPTVGQTDWLSEGISIQEAQLSLAFDIRKAGRKPTKEEALTFANRRNRLANRIDAFQGLAEQYLPGEDEVHNTVVAAGLLDESDDEGVGRADNEADGRAATLQDVTDVQPEHRPIHLPSTIESQQLSPSLIELRAREMELRKGQANDKLRDIRLGVAHRSFLFRTSLRHAHNYAGTTRAHRQVQNVGGSISRQRQIYNLARRSMLRLAVDEAEITSLAIYRPLLHSDVRADTTAIDFNQPGSRNTALSWIWSVGETSDSPAELIEVGRVNFLRAWCRRNRWEEEVTLLQKEADWVRRFFRHQKKTWEHRAGAASHPGYRGYAQSRARTWQELEATAQENLQKLPEYKQKVVDRFQFKHHDWQPPPSTPTLAPASATTPSPSPTPPDIAGDSAEAGM
ncbi:hypothetical protein BXZ70DRAFT_1013340 [Cristinia sonorae]|uniref:CxC2-like cysteine cluster KDZ transposase-associated domain-containing protein n=1 Tax=Cristinia sonorae TaxID=1940300 RepID=A0A8K0XJG9_9AGAR|nr:hypothetical protein BXZ70DRAFT_1013340 [Cristinia sonorae]